MADAKFTVQLIDKVSGGARNASRSLGTLAGRLGSTNKAAEASAGRFRDVAGKLREANGQFVAGAGKAKLFGAELGGAMDVFKGNLLTMAASKMFGLAKATAAAGFEMVTFGQNSRLAFSQLAHDGQEPAKLFEHSRALAKRFGLDLMETTHQYQDFLKLQFSPKAADSMIRMGADLRALGTDAEGVKGVFMALGQIKGKGRLQGEEMLQLAERGVSTVLIQEEIGKLTGKDVLGVQKAMQAGKINAEVGLLAIENAIKRKLGETNLGEAGARFADTTIDGMLGRIKTIGQDAGLTMIDQVTAPLTRLAGKGLEALEGFLTSPRGAEMIGTVASALGRAADFAIVLGDAFSSGFGEAWNQLAAGASEMFAAFSSDGQSTGELIKSLGRGLGQVAALAIGFAGALGVVAAGTGLLAGGLWDVATAVVDGLVGTLGTAVGRVISWWDGLVAIWNDKGTSLVGKMFSIGGEIIRGLVDGMNELIWMPFDAIARVGTGIADKLANILGIHSPSRVTMAMGRQLGAGLAIGTTQSSGAVMAASAGLAGASMEGLYGPASPLPSFGEGMPQRGGGPISVSQTIHVDGTSGDAEQIGRIAARESRRELESFFRHLAMEV